MGLTPFAIPSCFHPLLVIRSLVLILSHTLRRIPGGRLLDSFGRIARNTVTSRALLLSIASNRSRSSTKEHPMFDLTMNRNARSARYRAAVGARVRQPAATARGWSPWRRGSSFPAARRRTCKRTSSPTSPGLAQVTDSSLVNPWGVSFGPTSPFWVSNQGTSTSTVYAATPTGISKVRPDGQHPDRPHPGPRGPPARCSMTRRPSRAQRSVPRHFIFANLNGTISAWNGGTAATVECDDPRCQLHGPGHRLEHRG